LKKLTHAGGCKVFPAHNFVYRPSVRQARATLGAGEIGQIIHASFVSTHAISAAHAAGWRSQKRLASGGALMDSGHHLIYQSIYMLGVPSRCHAFTAKNVLTGMECEDTAQVSLLYPDSSLGVIMQSWASNHGDGVNGIRIVGEKGNILITDAFYLNGRKITDDLDDVDYAESFKHQAKAFCDYILNDRQPLSGLEDVLATLKVTYAAYESAEQGKVVNVS